LSPQIFLFALFRDLTVVTNMTNTDDNKWIDLGRPATLNEFEGHPDVVESIKSKFAKSSRQSILFHGPAGTGKTSLAHIIGRHILGDLSQMLDINASKDNGVDVVRNVIVPRVRNSSFDGSPHVVFLDEADNMTPQAQEALRRVMDDYGKNALFIIATNDLSAIIDPIQSRCKGSTYMIGMLDNESIERLLIRIFEELSDMTLENETVAEVIKNIANTCDGDARAAVDILQSWHDGSTKTEKILGEDSKFHDFIKAITNEAYVDPLELLGYVEETQLTRLFRFIVDTGSFSRDQLETISHIFADTDIAMQRSHNKDIHLIDMIYRLEKEALKWT